MLTYIVKEPLKYDGRQLSSLWAFRNFGLQGDSIISFRGPCDVAITEMVDQADVRENAPIYSENMLHFIIEHFDIDLEKTVVRQRLLVAIIKDVLSQRAGVKLTRRGDDLFQDNLKLSVSIATMSPVSTMIHTALNVSSCNTPVPTIGLMDMGWAEGEILKVGEAITQAYAAEMESIHLARCKVRGVN